MTTPTDSADILAPSSPRSWHRLVPSMTQWLWLVILIILLAQPWRTMMVSSDGDSYMHWRVGEWMLQHKQIIQSDSFSHTRFGQPIVSKEWLSEIIFAVAGRVAGLYGLAVVAAFLIATAFAFLHHQLLRETNNHAVAIGVTLIAVWAACVHWLARPHAFSFLLAVLWSDALRRFERGRSARRLILTLAGLMVLWVNLHGGYLAGFITLGAYWLGALTEMILVRADATKRAAARQHLAVLSIAAALCAGVSLINPSGYELHLHNLQFLHSEYLTNWLAEYASSDFHGPESRGFLAWLALTFFTLVLTRPRVSPASAILLITWTYLALYAGRNIPFLAIFTAPILATAIAEGAPHWLQRLSARLQEVSEVSRCSWLIAAIAAVILAAIPRPTIVPAKNWPVAARQFILQHPERFTGNMLNQYAWGGYLMEMLPSHRVFVDGRTDFYGESLIREFHDVTALHTNWTLILSRYDIAWTLMPADHRLNAALALKPEWEREYADSVSVIYRRLP
jgi:hypothetical protein